VAAPPAGGGGGAGLRPGGPAAGGGGGRCCCCCARMMNEWMDQFFLPRTPATEKGDRRGSIRSRGTKNKSSEIRCGGPPSSLLGVAPFRRTGFVGEIPSDQRDGQLACLLACLCCKAGDAGERRTSVVKRGSRLTTSKIALKTQRRRDGTRAGRSSWSHTLAVTFRTQVMTDVSESRIPSIVCPSSRTRHWGETDTSTTLLLSTVPRRRPCLPRCLPSTPAAAPRAFVP
jgi:hypothetical protein